MAKKKLDWKKVLEKFLKAAGAVLLAGLAVEYGNHPLYLALAPMILAGWNAWKHR